MARTTKDLIAELQDEAQSCAVLALVVGFEANDDGLAGALDIN